MGSYATLYIGGREIYSDKDDVNQVLMTLFQASERRILRGTIQEIAPDLLDEDGENADEKIDILKYETTVGALKDRLDLMGFSFQFIENEFERARSARLSTPSMEIEESPHREFLEARYKLERRVFEELTFNKWQRLFEKLWKEDALLFESRSSIPEPPIDAPVDDLHIWYMREYNRDMPYGFISHDPRVFLRLACDLFSSDTPAVYDLTEIVVSSYQEDLEYVASIAEEYLDGGYASTRRIIVLTEGRSDQRAVEGALGLLRPNIKNFFSFLDFETLTIQGGVPAVLITLKAFISVGVANRIVAILDNDTAAHAALQSAKLTVLPANVRILFLPNIKLAENYPTLGPTGLAPLNINGLACSIELFFGSDVLKNSSGALTPIQWKGYDDKLRRYHGEILCKQEIQERFTLKLEEARQNPSLFKTQDWTSMELVIESLISAFHDTSPIDYGLEKFE